MITTTNLPGAAHAIPQERPTLVDQLARKADVNRDGTVTTAEFTAFLGGLLQTLDRDEAARDAEPPVPPAAVVATEADPRLAVTPQPSAAVESLRRAIRRTEGDK